MKVTLAAFKANKTVADVTQKVFQAVDPVAANRSTAPAPTLALVPTVGGSRSTISRMSIPAKASISAKTLAAPKQTFK